MTQQYVLSRKRIVDTNGVPLGGAKLYSYEAGTTTPLDTFNDSTLSVANSNPLVADANGTFDYIFLAADDYRFVFEDADGNTLATFEQDDYEVIASLTFTGGLEKVGNTVQLASGVNNQTGTSYTIQTSDRGKLISFSNTSAIAATLPAAGASFPDGFYFDIQNRNTGLLTLTSSSNIDGASSLSFEKDEGARIYSDGSTYYTQRGYYRSYVDDEIAKLFTLPTIANNSTDSDHDIDFSAGNFRFSDNSGSAAFSALTKQIDASWSAGNNAGGLFTGSVATDTWYYCFAIYNPSTGVVDAGFDTSITAANAPSGFTKYRYLGAVLTDGSSNIIGFLQKGSRFYWQNPIEDLSGAWTSTDLTISAPPNSEASLDILIAENQDLRATMRSLALTGTPTYKNIANDWASGSWSGGDNNIQKSILLDGSSQLRIDVTTATGSGSTANSIYTLGWYDFGIQLIF